MPRPTLVALLAVAFSFSPPLARALGWRALDASPSRYEATLAGWTLTVDTTRARLVSAVPPGGAARDNILLGGGHRVWLGPQSEWPAFWPAPRDWENSPAAAVALSADATELTLFLPRSDPRYPALIRRYRLLPDALLLVAAWRPEAASDSAPSSLQAVQILQTRADTRVDLTPLPTPAAPLGHGLLALAVRPGMILDRPIPAGFATRIDATDTAAGALRLAFTGEEEKIGVPAQPLVAHFAGGHGLRLHPAAHDAQGAVIDDSLPAPEAGLFTQAYFGATAWSMVEIEQLSPRLRPLRSGDEINVTVRLEFLPPR